MLADMPEYLAANPFLAVAGKTAARLSTARGAPSQHGDGPNRAFLVGPLKTGRDGNELQEPSVVFGGYGMSVLRGGAPGKRLEVLFSHDRVTGHAHDDMLGIQLQYRGVPLLDYLGDSRLGRFIDLREDHNPAAKGLKALKFPAPMMVSDMNRKSFSMDLAVSAVTKNTLIIDEYDHTSSGRESWRGGYGAPDFPYGNLVEFKGGEAPGSPEADVQFAEAVGEGMLAHHSQGVRNYRRALVCVTRPDGNPYLLDIFRAVGGNRHLMLYHCRGDMAVAGLSTKGKTYASLQEWLDTVSKERGEWRPPFTDLLNGRELLNQITVWSKAPQAWDCVWKLDYAAWAPKTAKVNSDSWREDGVSPICLKMFGAVVPGETNAALVTAKSNLPATIDEVVEGKRVSGMVEFKDAINYIGELRLNNERLASTFVHVMEPWLEGVKPSIAKVIALRQEKDIMSKAR